MSGASGKVPAAIHLTPEAAAGGPIAKIANGDIVHLDATSGTLSVGLGDVQLRARQVQGTAPGEASWTGTGRELFAAFRHHVGAADRGASIIPQSLETTAR